MRVMASQSTDTQLLVQKFVRATNKQNTAALRYWTFEMEIHWIGVGHIQKVSKEIIWILQIPVNDTSLDFCNCL